MEDQMDIYIWIDTDRRIAGRHMDGWMDGWMDGQTDQWTR